MGDKNLGGAPLYTSDYFDRLYQSALELIDKGKAYVDDMTAEETDEFRRLGKESRFRNRSIEENRDLFERMKAGEFLTGHERYEQRSMSTRPMSGCAIPCSIASATPLITIPGTNGRFIRCYDWAHTLSDYIEGITHSVCTLEFEVHRPLYDWILQALELPPPVPHQYEFAPTQSYLYGDEQAKADPAG